MEACRAQRRKRQRRREEKESSLLTAALQVTSDAEVTSAASLLVDAPVLASKRLQRLHHLHQSVALALRPRLVNLHGLENLDADPLPVVLPSTVGSTLLSDEAVEAILSSERLPAVFVIRVLPLVLLTVVNQRPRCSGDLLLPFAPLSFQGNARFSVRLL